MKAFIYLSPILSLLLYLFAPSAYSWGFCTVCFTFFLLIAIFLIKEDNKYVNSINFNLLFLLSFFLCSYAFPVFIYGTSSIIEAHILNHISSMGTFNHTSALCTFAISCYALGYILNRKTKSFYRATSEYQFKDIVAIKNGSKFLYFVTCVISIFVLIRFLRISSAGIEVEEAPFTFQLMTILLSIGLVISTRYFKVKGGFPTSIFQFFKQNLFYIIPAAIVLGLFFYIGDRLYIMVIALVVLTTYSLCVKRISYKKLILIGFIGVLVMFALRVTRTNSELSIRGAGVNAFIESTKNTSQNTSTFWDYFSDLTGISMELNAGYEYSQTHDLYYPGRIFVSLLAPFPLLPSMASETFFGVSTNQLSPGYAIATYTSTHAGSHCVIDAYMSYGLIGVCLLFLILGLFVGFVTNHVKTNVMYDVLYICLITNVVFATRGSLFFLIRPICWTCVLVVLLRIIKLSKN